MNETRSPAVIPPLTRDQAETLLTCARDVRWLEMLRAEARGRGMAVLSVAIRKEIELRRAMFWSTANRAGFLFANVQDIELATRRAIVGDA